MTIIQLEYLVAVANNGSFSLAADQCFVTQPSLSVQIRNLEEELGAVLLDRTKKPVVPTEIGRLVIENAQKALKSFHYVREGVNEARSEVAGMLRLGMIPTVAPYMLPRLLPAFSERYPKVELDVVVRTTPEIVAEIARDAIDAAIVCSGTTPSNLVEQELFDDRFLAYVSPLNNLSERSSIRIEDVKPKELLILSERHCLRDQVIELCRLKRNHRSPYNVAGDSLETLMHIVDATPTLTIIPEMAARYVDEKRCDNIKTLAKGATSRKIAIVVRRTYVKKTLIKALGDVAAEVMK
ncbi:MAG: LysR family transcriptional regulator [Rikenellaceae bacterium]|jgi:LysR family hydrogen peroxide-inducible transcriptional activator|nr:LysR family transcriptional regulator [Rikenellaceae bacterium]